MLPAGTANLPVPHGLSANAKADLTQISEDLARINKHEANSTQVLKQLGCLAFCFSDAILFILDTDLVLYLSMTRTPVHHGPESWRMRI